MSETRSATPSVSFQDRTRELIAAVRAILPKYFTSLVGRFFEEGAKVAIIAARAIDERVDGLPIGRTSAILNMIGDIRERAEAALVQAPRETAQHEMCVWAAALVDEVDNDVGEDGFMGTTMNDSVALGVVFQFIRGVRTF